MIQFEIIFSWMEWSVPISESLSEFLQALHVISKDCSLTDVTAEEYRKELVRDAFINGMSSYHARQRLLENNELTLEAAFNIANSLRMAQEHSAAYLPQHDVVASISSSGNKGSDWDSDQNSKVLGSMSKLQCTFCGQAFHNRKGCPARESVCYSCNKKEHFTRVCCSKYWNSTHKKPSAKSHLAALFLSLCTISAACPGA